MSAVGFLEVGFWAQCNDLPVGLDSSCFMFADNTKIFSKIISHNDFIHLQHDISNGWSSLWKLQLNATKCKILSVGNSTLINSRISWRREGQQSEQNIRVYKTNISQLVSHDVTTDHKALVRFNLDFL